MRPAARIAGGLVGVVGLVGVTLVGALAVGVWRTPSQQLPRGQATPVNVDREAVAALLSEAIQHRTVTRHGEPLPAEALLGLHQTLIDHTPRAHEVLRREVVDELALLYTWQGSDPSLEPAVFMGHLDVVPVEPAALPEWEQPPFSGRRSGGFVWGRGAIDNKMNVVGLLRAVEELASQGFQPRRTLLLAFGHDEEIGGEKGAARLAATVGQRHPRLHMVLDEGGVISVGNVPSLSRPTALVGIAEKGYLDLKLSVRGAGGHASMPPNHTAAGRIGRAVARLEDHQRPASLDGPAAEMFRWLAPEMDGVLGVLMSNLWLAGPIVEGRLLDRQATAATIRTTTAVTMLSGSQQSNVLPAEATATVNFRVRPGETLADVEAHVREVIDDDDIVLERVGIHSEPSAVSPTDGVFAQLQEAVGETFDDVVVAPFLVVGMTDSRYFEPLSDHVYRFTAVTLEGDDLDRIHGTNERIAEADLEAIVAYYMRLMQKIAG